jgi:hypothetical protein
MFPRAVKIPVAGLKTSALESTVFKPLEPPVIRMVPFGKRVEEWRTRGEVMLPVGVQIPVFGSNSSVLASSVTVKGETEILFTPPATSTLPSGKSVAEWKYLAAFKLPVGAKVPVPGV